MKRWSGIGWTKSGVEKEKSHEKSKTRPFTARQCRLAVPWGPETRNTSRETNTLLRPAGSEGGRPDQGAAVGADREPRACAVALAATVHMALPATSKTNPLRTTRFQSRFE